MSARRISVPKELTKLLNQQLETLYSATVAQSLQSIELGKQIHHNRVHFVKQQAEMDFAALSYTAQIVELAEQLHAMGEALQHLPVAASNPAAAVFEFPNIIKPGMTMLGEASSAIDVILASQWLRSLLWLRSGHSWGRTSRLQNLHNRSRHLQYRCFAGMLQYYISWHSITGKLTHRMQNSPLS